MSLYDTLNQLKTKVHCSEMTAATALDTLYQAAMNQDPTEPCVEPIADGSSATGIPPFPELSPAEQDAANAALNAGGDDTPVLTEIVVEENAAPPAEDNPIDPDGLMNG